MPRFPLVMLLAFALTLFTSATLLFLVQPMIGKMTLPLLGGTPEVWNTCMVFFQAMLLAGYAYAHATTRWLGVRRQAGLHLAVLLLPVLLFAAVGPLVINRNFIVGGGNPIAGVLLVLVVAVGLPFFVVSTTSPLLQQWFSSTDHPAARDPYFLSTASNLGSMLALVGYPVLVEPYLSLKDQRLAWGLGYGLYVLLTGTCAVLLWKAGVAAPAPVLETVPALAPEPAKALAAAGAASFTADEPRGGKVQARPHGKGRGRKNDRPERVTKELSPAPAPIDETALTGAVTAARRLRWVMLAFVPSSLMMGVTTYMTTDIAAIPLLWVLPLGLYLLSFILVFAKIPSRVQGVLVFAMVFLALCGFAKAAYSWLGEQSSQVQLVVGLVWLAAVVGSFAILWFRDPSILHKFMVLVLPLMVLLLVFMMLTEFEMNIGYKIMWHLALMFVVAMVCHGTMVRDRPPTQYLTEFYMWMSFGGVLGGIFNALIAPAIFNSLAEYSLAMVFACMLLPPLVPNEAEEPSNWGRYADLILVSLFVLVGGCLLGCRLISPRPDFSILQNGGWGWMAVGVALTLSLGFLYAMRPARGPVGRFALQFPLALYVFVLMLIPLAVVMGLGLADERRDYLLVLRASWAWLLATVAFGALIWGYARLRPADEARPPLALRDALAPGLVALALILSGVLVAASVFARVTVRSDLLAEVRSRLAGFDGLRTLRDGWWVWLLAAATGGLVWGVSQLRGAAPEERAAAGPRAALTAALCGAVLLVLGFLVGFGIIDPVHDVLGVRKGAWLALFGAGAVTLIAAGVLVSRVPVPDRLRVGMRVILPGTLAVLALVPAAFLLGLCVGDSTFLGAALSARSWRWLVGTAGLLLGVASLMPLMVRNCSLRQFTPSLDIAVPVTLLVLTIGLIWGMQSEVLYYRIKALAAATPLTDHRIRLILSFGLPAVLCYTFVERSLRFGLGVGAILLAGAFANLFVDTTVYEHRTYFGVLKVEAAEDIAYLGGGVTEPLPNYRLVHGTTLHGKQYLKHQYELPEMLAGAVGVTVGHDGLAGVSAFVAAFEGYDYSHHALTYYHRTGPMGSVMRAFNRSAADRIGVIGLGTGTLAAYARPGQTVVFYDIDPAVKKISFDRRDYFSFVQDAKARGADVQLVLGDARLEIERFLARNPDLPEAEKYSVLAVDAFSSDAIPIHLITREAVQHYLALVRADGVLAFHISNRYLDLKPVLANIAEKESLALATESDIDGLRDPETIGKSAATWVMLTRDEKTLNRLVTARRWDTERETARANLLPLVVLPDGGTGVQNFAWAVTTLLGERAPQKSDVPDRTSFPVLDAPWQPVPTKRDVGVWTDDYSNLLKVFDWGW